MSAITGAREDTPKVEAICAVRPILQWTYEGARALPPLGRGLRDEQLGHRTCRALGEVRSACGARGVARGARRTRLAAGVLVIAFGKGESELLLEPLT